MPAIQQRMGSQELQLPPEAVPVGSLHQKEQVRDHKPHQHQNQPAERKKPARVAVRDLAEDHGHNKTAELL